jgi:hypothetical protein
LAFALPRTAVFLPRLAGTARFFPRAGFARRAGFALRAGLARRVAFAVRPVAFAVLAARAVVPRAARAARSPAALTR